MTSTAARFLSSDGLQSLIDALLREGYDVIGPTVEQNAVVLRSIRSVKELPVGFTDEQAPAVYRLSQSNTKTRDESQRPRCFHFNVGPDSWKRFLFPPESSLGGAKLDDEGWHFRESSFEPPKYAFLGIRACDLAAIAIQDRVFAPDPNEPHKKPSASYVDPIYSETRSNALLIAVNCSKSAATCFCSSMGTGPKCTSGFDLSMTELEEGYVIEAGSERGAELLSSLQTIPATQTELQSAKRQIEATKESMTKTFQSEGVRELLMSQLNHPEWQKVAQRCLSCTNCTMVCPTCFCHSVTEETDLHQTAVERIRRWDSCFNIELSEMVGENARPEIRSRYRQWLTHKLATWQDQFDTSGCTGCGRCITWCPVGIDLTETVDSIRDSADAS